MEVLCPILLNVEKLKGLGIYIHMNIFLFIIIFIILYFSNYYLKEFVF